ncbi:MAG: LemA family protein [candidate division WOR-3 bacterium]|nr:LemA family protein [candidate division WOR-3 bacterium]MCX7836633.1 LemA family protein [candidate division WOR-3 bacterium]MDW8113319.1 LemA family protein [candidate division WOR-3 bacterium]
MIILIIVIVLIIIYLIATYNLLIVKRTRVKNAWQQIDVQLKRRYDLIPNLVETVKGYAAHEKEIFEKVSEARAKAMGAKSVKESAEANNELTQTLKTLFALVEAYPDLKANENFLRLQEELTTTENRIAFARQFYNDVVMSYNILCEQFPSNIVAKIFNFQPAEFYAISEGEKEVPKVKF